MEYNIETSHQTSTQHSYGLPRIHWLIQTLSHSKVCLFRFMLGKWLQLWQPKFDGINSSEVLAIHIQTYEGWTGQNNKQFHFPPPKICHAAVATRQLQSLTDWVSSILLSPRARMREAWLSNRFSPSSVSQSVSQSVREISSIRTI